MHKGKSIFAPNHYCVHHGGVYMEGEIKLGKVVNHNWNEKLKKVTKYDMEFEDGTILENVKAEDILVTEASIAEEHMGHAAKRDEEELEEGEVPAGLKAYQDKKKKKSSDDSEEEEDMKEGSMPMQDEPEGKDLNDDGKKGHGKVPAFLNEDDDEDKIVDEGKEEEKEETNENWFKGNKNQLLFERLVKKWAK